MALWTITAGALALWTQGWGETVVDNWSHGAAALTLSQLARHGETWNIGITQVFATVVLTSPIFYMLAQNALLHKQSYK